ncbi:MAG: glycosyltransferase [Patescibacteria group bacterium]
MIKDRDIICLSFSDWRRELVSNRYHILTRYAKNNRVFLFERPIYLGDWHRWQFIFKPVRFEENIYMIAPLGIGIDNRVYDRYLSEAMAYFGIQKPIFWFYNFYLSRLIDFFQPTLSCYHCTEDYYNLTYITSQKESIEPARQLIKQEEGKLLKKVDIVFAVSRYLKEKHQKINPQCYLTENAVNYQSYQRAQKKSHKIFGQRLVLGYCGNLSSKVNFQLLYQLAKDLSECYLVLAGPIVVKNTRLEKLKKLTNVKFMGNRPFSDLPFLIGEFDVCLIPYIQDQWFVRTAQPLKLFEYLASGKPIVSTRMDCLKKLQDVVYQSNSEAEFIAKTKIALKEKNPELRKKRILLAKNNTWDQRFAFINQKMEDFINNNE